MQAILAVLGNIDPYQNVSIGSDHVNTITSKSYPVHLCYDCGLIIADLLTLGFKEIVDSVTRKDGAALCRLWNVRIKKNDHDVSSFN